MFVCMLVLLFSTSRNPHDTILMNHLGYVAPRQAGNLLYHVSDKSLISDSPPLPPPPPLPKVFPCVSHFILLQTSL